MSSKIVPVILFLSQCIVVYCVKCKVTQSFNQTPSTCDGDYCMKDILTFGDSPSATQEIFGCISGFPYAEPGCFVEEVKSTSVCFCNNSDSCTEHDISNTTKTLNRNLQCYEGEVKDGKILGNKKCPGFFCSLTQSWYGNRKNVTLKVGCHEFVSPPLLRFFKGKGCIHGDSPDSEIGLKFLLCII